MITWFHISDIHLNRSGVETRRMRKQLLSFLKKKQIRSKYIFFTGDLRYAPDGDFDSDTVPFLDSLAETLGVEKRNVFIVPGNHDIERDNSDRSDALRVICNNDSDYYNPKVGTIGDSELEKIYTSEKDFALLMDKFYDGLPDRACLYHDWSKPHFTVVSDDFNIIHVNSTLTYSADHENDLIIGTEKLMDALDDIDKKKPSILITHYSFDFLAREEQKEVLKLLTDYNVQLWFAGHEHDNILRKQRDYFYEFQSGNLLYEEGDIKSSVLLGNYNEESHGGIVYGIEWDSESGWKLSHHISNQNDPDKYIYELDTDNSLDKALEISVTDDKFVKKIEKPYAFSKYGSNNNLNLNMSSDVFLTNKDNNIEAADFPEIQSYDEIQKYKGLICLDSSIVPSMSADVIHMRNDAYDRYDVQTEAMTISFYKIYGIESYMVFSYNLSGYTDVDERLLLFRQIREYQDASNVFIKMVGHEEENIMLDRSELAVESEDNYEETSYWIRQMEKISKIENYFGVKFYLPIKASDDDNLAIEVLSDSIDGKSCRTLPPVHMKNHGLRKTMHLNRRISIGNVERLMQLTLFGYTFKPIDQYILEGDYVYKRNKGWIRKGHNGITVGVDFEISFDDEKNRELVKYIPFDEESDEFDLNSIPELDGDIELFFKSYIDITYRLHENRQLFLNYRDSQRVLLGDSKPLSSDMLHPKKLAIDKITINRVVDNIVSAGRKLIKATDGLLSDYCSVENNSIEKFGDNLEFLWMLMMNSYSASGHFPISVSSDGAWYYDLKTIKAEAESDNDQSLEDLTETMRGACEVGSNYELSFYNCMRNYSYILAQIQKDYYDEIIGVINEYVERMDKIIMENPALIHKGKRYQNVVAYLMKNDQGNLHIFDKDSDVMADVHRYRNDAIILLEHESQGFNGNKYI